MTPKQAAASTQLISEQAVGFQLAIRRRERLRAWGPSFSDAVRVSGGWLLLLDAPSVWLIINKATVTSEEYRRSCAIIWNSLAAAKSGERRDI